MFVLLFHTPSVTTWSVLLSEPPLYLSDAEMQCQNLPAFLDILLRHDIPALATDIFTLMALASTIQHRIRLAQQTVDAILLLFSDINLEEKDIPSHLTPEILLSLAPPPRHVLPQDVRHQLLKKLSNRCLKVGSMVSILH